MTMKNATHCKHGHEFTPENTRVRTNGKRRCLECVRLYSAGLLPKISSQDLFLAKVDKSLGHGPWGDCWIWLAGVDQMGYGRFWLAGKTTAAHRASFVFHKGKIPMGLLVCHTCDNPPCVNPSHLFLGTEKDNAMDMINKGRQAWANITHCPRGHEYSVENTGRYKLKSGYTIRSCRTCARERARIEKGKKVANAIMRANALNEPPPKPARNMINRPHTPEEYSHAIDICRAAIKGSKHLNKKTGQVVTLTHVVASDYYPSVYLHTGKRSFGTKALSFERDYKPATEQPHEIHH